MRYHVKGGIWKNTEDEILKAAVMKYGLNQWSRISSLLVRKSAKQCKERWYEWLDPKIKKTEWTKDEEEKLLHLAKMFPCQWRTISPFVGRTAYQCLEHYEYLLDKAQGRENDVNDPRKLRPGEIDPNPEAKPARPDPIDLDEDTKETLNEARARVANTRGKKAKRKIREKQLEEARRLAALQKKRELKSAGIEIVLRLPKKKKKEMNYNNDIPFMREVPKGSFSNQLEEVPEPDVFKGGISLQYLENRQRDIEEEKQRKLDEKRMRSLKQKNLPYAIEMINKLNDPGNVMNRKELTLPEPQVVDKDLKDIVKMMNSNNNNNESGNCTEVLKGDYEQVREIAVEKMRTPQGEDVIMTQARIAVSLREGKTPLIGGENARKDLEMYLSSRNVQKEDIKEFKTPMAVSVVKNINTPSSYINNNNKKGYDCSYENDNESLIWESEYNESKCNKKMLFANIPKPKNQFEIEINTDDNDNDVNKLNSFYLSAFNTPNQNVLSFPDAENNNNNYDNDNNNNNNNINTYHSSLVITNNLPRINLSNKTISSFINNNSNLQLSANNNHITKAFDLINQHMLSLIHYDNIEHPIKGMKISNEMHSFTYTAIPHEEKEYIEEIISNEFGGDNDNNKAHNVYENVNINDNTYLYKQYQKELQLNQKLINKHNTLYIELNKKHTQLKQNIQNEISSLQLNRMKYNLYNNLLNKESISFLNRKHKKENELNKLYQYERKLQNKYKQLI